MSWQRFWARRIAGTSSRRPYVGSSRSTKRPSSGGVAKATPERGSDSLESRFGRHHGAGCGASPRSKERGPGRDTRGTGPQGARRGGTTQFSRQDAALRDLARGLDSHYRH